MFSGASGLDLPEAFIGSNCIQLDSDCPTSGSGDVNFNGTVDISDIVSIINAILNGEALLAGCDLATADVSGNGSVDVVVRLACQGRSHRGQCLAISRGACVCWWVGEQDIIELVEVITSK